MDVITHSETETEKIAAALACELGSNDVLLLRGDLGAGKTVFARSLIRTLTGQSDLEVPSPTFTLVQTYETKAGSLWHFDLYRLKEADEVYELGWEEALSEGMVLVEWPERLGALTPARCLDISISTVENKDQQRNIKIKRHDP